MKKWILPALIGFFALTFTACEKEKETEPQNNDFTLGKNRFTTILDGDVREYYVHVPKAYDKTKPLPVVFMLHGTSGDGEKFYNISGWKELGETEGILTVFPSSWRYCIIDKDGRSNTTKWNVYPGSFEYCEGSKPRDDVKFLRTVVDELKNRFAVNEKQLYVVGFSNGGQMAFRCAVEMSDLFSAAVESGGTFHFDSVFTAKANIPTTFQCGASDNKWLGEDKTFPLSKMKEALDTDTPMRNIAKTHIKTFDLKSNYTLKGDTNTTVVATYAANGAPGTQEFNIALIHNMEHIYPNGKNFPLDGPKVNWNWMKQYHK